MDLTNLIPKQTEEKIKSLEALVNETGAIAVTNNAQYTFAGDFLKKIKGAYNEIEDERKKITKPLDDTKKAIMDFFNRPLKVLADAEQKLKYGMLTFVNEEEKKRLAMQAKLQEEARALEAKEKAKLEAKALKKEAKGDTETADALRAQAQAVQAPVPVLQSNVTAVGGVSTKKLWRYRITNMALIPREYMIVNEKMLGALATATKGAVPVAGVEFYQETVIASAGVK